ncbi:Protein CCC1 [Wickerhamiella sorbophila]|uniref:Protein CCC1 n=1 Tax=Wickerhamiella sorbophila TaxID=45607 RepID=A0A2T0FJ04_9ASCO|nr:Protein CCC1 [Wickerhamiella sorbophila]PRT54982.1 Protein CCC1 [Wickerhamiella sorbophila]
MVLVAVKNLITGGPTKPLLPTDQSQVGYQATTDGSFVSQFSIKEIENPRVVSDIIIGLSDGLTVPFALTAGLSSLGSAKLVITGGLAELVSGAISMGLGGYLAAKSESEYYETMLRKEKATYHESPKESVNGVQEALGEFNISPATVEAVMSDLQRNDEFLAAFMVKMVRGIEEPQEGRELTSALTIGGAYFLGGFVPLLPYFLVDTVEKGLIYSVVIMMITLFAFGYFKTVLSLGSDCLQKQRVWNGVSMLLVGGVAAGAAWALVKAIEA